MRHTIFGFQKVCGFAGMLKGGGDTSFLDGTPEANFLTQLHKRSPREALDEEGRLRIAVWCREFAAERTPGGWGITYIGSAPEPGTYKEVSCAS